MFREPLISTDPWFRVGEADEIRTNERSVGSLRIYLAAAGLIAITIDPAQPALYAGLTYTILALYVALPPHSS